ncbi:MAG: arsenical-resistance protein, partial [Cyanobium sp. LacPavin_0920_WC12_MAG_62_9]|nr:arsenical-resistance protein [Cyanobium sp. LacPavin_0920_WC12_MAG_62_9]
LQAVLGAVTVGQTSVPIALGLLMMLYPVLAKVRYGELGVVLRDRRLLTLALALVGGLGPRLMFGLAWLFLPDQAALRTGLIMIGLGGFYLQILPGWLGLDSQLVTFSMWEIAKAVVIFLGIPLAAGFLTRRIGVCSKGIRWYEQTFLPKLSPWALYGLLFTVVVMFALQGKAITSDPLRVAVVAIPLVLYFLIMWGVAFLLGRSFGLGYPRTTTLAFTAAGNNFELAIAVSISVWGASSQQALAGVIGPLIEVPILVGLVYVSLALKRWLFRSPH